MASEDKINYTFEEYIKVTHLPFIKKGDKYKDYVKIALLFTNIVLNKKLTFLGAKKEEIEGIPVKEILLYFAPLLTSFYIKKFYLGFAGECCDNLDFLLDKLEELTGDIESLKNFMHFLKVPVVTNNCGC